MQNSTPSNETSLTSTSSLMSNTANMPSTINNAIDAFLACKGQFASVTFKSNPKPAAAFKGVVLEKIVTNVFRAGVDFANLASVKEGIASNERGEVQPLAWGSWVNFPFVIEHKGERFLRLTSAGKKAFVVFKVNGVTVGKDEFESFLVPSARSENKVATEVISIKESNLISFDGEVA
jgi:hypothetical protein